MKWFKKFSNFPPLTAPTRQFQFIWKVSKISIFGSILCCVAIHNVITVSFVKRLVQNGFAILYRLYRHLTRYFPEKRYFSSCSTSRYNYDEYGVFFIRWADFGISQTINPKENIQRWTFPYFLRDSICIFRITFTYGHHIFNMAPILNVCWGNPCFIFQKDIRSI